MNHFEIARSRREFLQRSGCGFGSLALAGLLQNSLASATTSSDRQPPNSDRPQPHHRPTAKSVIFLFMEGGPSHIDTFDPKPLLNQLAGKPMPESFGEVITSMGESRSPLLASKRKWKQHGEAGTWVSDWLPHTATCVDDIAVIRSCWCDGINHSAGVCQMNTCSIIGGRPSLGKLGFLRFGFGKPRPACVCGDAGQQCASRQRSAQLGRGVHACGISRDSTCNKALDRSQT
jgi:hypothetical protein